MSAETWEDYQHRREVVALSRRLQDELQAAIAEVLGAGSRYSPDAVRCVAEAAEKVLSRAMQPA